MASFTSLDPLVARSVALGLRGRKGALAKGNTAQVCPHYALDGTRNRVSASAC